MPDNDDNDYDLWEQSAGDNPTVVLARSKYPVSMISFDMGWQQTASRKKYASPTGHACCVGGLSGKPIHFHFQVKNL